MNRWILIALLVAGCKQGLGDHCQTNADCTEGICSATKHVCVAVGTSSDGEIDAPLQPPSIRSFQFLASVNAALAADVIACGASPSDAGTVPACGTSITATVPTGTDVSALKATFDTNGVAVIVGNTPQLSGNVANDFRRPVTYTVVGVDGAMQSFTVTVTFR